MKNPYFKIISSADLQDPEVLAMLQAFYSRSPMPIEERLASFNDGDTILKTERIRNALKMYYVDYGHASIGECGGCTVFIENVSMLAAKAIQDHPLYVGQECSTRYIDFSHQDFLTAQNTVGETTIQARWRALYLQTLPQAKTWARKTFSPDMVLSGKIAADKREAAFDKTCNAIAFDVCRSLLPAGASTSLAWTANFRVFNDHLRFLSQHPLAEVRQIAKDLYGQLAARFKNSFKQEPLGEYDLYEPTEVFYTTTSTAGTRPIVEHHIWGNQEDLFYHLQHQPSQRYRHLADHTVHFEIRGLLDFGSFRDLARHRPGLNKNALTSRDYGFERYYERIFQDIDPGIMNTVNSILSHPVYDLVNRVDAQYICPMGMRVPVHLQWTLGQLRYVMRLRTKTSVHPTLRNFMSYTHEIVERQLPSVAHLLEIDRSQHYEASDRGEQTFKTRVESDV